MSEYGFNYFLERSQVLTEMARPVSVFTTIDPGLAPIQDTYIKLMNQVGPIVGKDTGKRQFFIYAYLLSNLMEVIDPDLDMDVGAFASEITGRTQRDFNTMKAGFLKAAQLHKDIVNSPDFAQQALDQNNIEQYYRNREIVGGSRRTGYKNEVQNTLGTTAEDFQSISNEAQPIVAALNKVMHGRNVSRGQKGDESKYAKPQQAANSEAANPNVDFAYSIIDAIETMLENKALLQKDIKAGMLDVEDLDRASKILAGSKTADGDLGVLKQMYEKMISEGTGTTPEEFTAYLEKLSGLKGITPERAMIFSLLENEVEELTSFSDSIKDAQLSHGGSGKDYTGYDADVIAKILDTPQKAELFDKWYHLNTQWRQAKNEKLEQLWMRQLIQQNFFDRKGIEDDGSNYLSADIQALLNQQAKLTQAMGQESRPEKIEAYRKQIMNIADQIKFKRGEKTTEQPEAQQPEEQEESGVMGYMAEQVGRDAYGCKKNGKFVDRGFRKPVNYAHWLQING